MHYRVPVLPEVSLLQGYARRWQLWGRVRGGIPDSDRGRHGQNCGVRMRLCDLRALAPGRPPEDQAVRSGRRQEFLAPRRGCARALPARTLAVRAGTYLCCVMVHRHHVHRMASGNLLPSKSYTACLARSAGRACCQQCTARWRARLCFRPQCVLRPLVAGVRLSGNMEVSVTTLPWLRNARVTEFADNAVRHAARAAAHAARLPFPD